MPEYVGNMDQFNQFLKDAKDKLVVVDFTATWCGPCKKMSPIFDAQAGLPENSDVVFLKVDVDEAEDVSAFCNITCMPTFQFYKNSKKVDEFSGANEQLLLEKLNKLK